MEEPASSFYTDLPIGSVCFLLLVIGYIGYARRRNFYPLKSRSFVLKTFVTISSLVHIAGLVLKRLGAIPCFLWAIILYGNPIFFGGTLVVDAYRTYFERRIRKELGSNQVFQYSQWIRKIGVDVFFFVVIISHVAVFVILSASFDSDAWTFEVTKEDCINTNTMVLVLTPAVLYCVFHGVALGVLFRRNLATMEDNLKLMRDIKLMSILWSVSIVVWGITSVIEFPLFPRVLIMIALLSSFYVTVGWATYDSFEDEKLLEGIRRDTLEKSQEMVLQENVSLRAVLRTPALRQLFDQFLRGEWSIENLLFFDDVNEWKEHAKPTFERGKEIYFKYVKMDGPYQINISAAASTGISDFFEQDSVDEVNKNIFDEALEEVYSMMRNCSFPRFKRSKLFQTAMEEGISVIVPEDEREEIALNTDQMYFSIQ